MTDVQNLLVKIQRDLKAPKNQLNKFGGYKYRSCEDILEAVKPLLDDGYLTLSDEIQEAATHVYVKATATLSLNGASISASALARDPIEKKGSDASQNTGAASSYARKYALNGLFLIDDTKDADSMDAPKPETKPAAKSAQHAMVNEINNLKDQGAAVAWLEQNERDINEMIPDQAAMVMQAYENKIAQFANGVVTPATWSWRGTPAEQVDAWIKKAKTEFDRCDILTELSEKQAQVQHKIDALGQNRKTDLLAYLQETRAKIIKASTSTLGAG